ncbi:hypothetical protein NW762_009913 [Fusarium torreyae]|uniref:Uncharacterized protein n=1 Tax=Fusarium torreyae TaxID=1237075 RepID=A0A9W8RV52_9HYPO|nr:hypothetical protein NW762_009913 [Fusarium torreyae]
MCQDLFVVWAPCAHWEFRGVEKCDKAKTLKSALKKGLLKKQCEPENVIQFIIDWCPQCIKGFTKIIKELDVIPVTYHGLWDQRLMERYFAIKSQNRWFYAVEPKMIGYEALASRDSIEYIPNSIGRRDAKTDVPWELYALEAEVRRIKPVLVWIQGYAYAPAGDMTQMLRLCEKAIFETKKKAYHFGHVDW